MRYRLLLWLFMGSLCSPVLFAQQVTDIQQRAEALALHKDPAWLTLGHYRHALFGALQSQADDSEFFLSETGKHDPEAELKATLNAILAEGQGNGHARCRFPARDAWLRKKLTLPRTNISCPALDQWMEELNTETVTLVFAASYLNSPSSMFGHTFLRLDPPKTDGGTDLLLANTISYAADANAHESEILFAYKGIFGGYPGITSIRPYYEMVKLYSDLENRDMWEYELNLSPTETRQLLFHTWEIRNKRFDYYFLDENCAYRLLALIDAARPGTRLLDEVSTHAIPSDTVRWVLQKDLVADIHYRPSAATVVAATIKQLSPAERDAVLGISTGDLTPGGPLVTAMPAADQARIHDAAYDYVRYQAQAEDWPRARAAPLSHQILMARSALDQQGNLKPPVTPSVRDDQGHDTFRAGIWTGRELDRNFLELSLRPAYHDILDPPGGYRPGAQLQFLRLDTRLYLDNQEIQLERFTAVEIRSLAAADRFFTPLSWQVGVGARRTRTGTGDDDRTLAPYLDGGAGYLVDFLGWQAGALLTADLEIDDDLDRGWDFGPGTDLLLLQQHGQVSFNGGVRSKWWLVGDRDRQDALYASASVHFGKAQSLSLSASRSHIHIHGHDRYDTSWKAGWQVYF